MKFIRLTDTEQIRFRIQPGLSEKDREKGMAFMRNFYAIANRGTLLKAEDSGEILLLNRAKKRSVSEHSTSLANFDPMRPRKKSEQLYGISVAPINAEIKGRIKCQMVSIFVRIGFQEFTTAIFAKI